MTFLTEEADSWGERIPNTSETERKPVGNHPSIYPSILPSFTQPVSHEGPWGVKLVGENCISSQEDAVLERNRMQLEVVFHRAHTMKGKARNPVQPLPLGMRSSLEEGRVII